MIRLTSKAMITDRELTKRVAQFIRRLRAKVPLEYLIVNEFHGHHRHMHILVRAGADVSGALVSELWSELNPGKGLRSSYCEPVRNPVALARYLVKHVHDPAKKQVAPRTYSGKVMTYSKGFLSQKMKTLEREVVGEWKRRREHRRAGGLLSKEVRARS
jgi:hypothetical protein